ncbi:MAG: polymerase delta subunit [Clostridia bacterium]|nr:polymerase delta subunit [Clostridia bacterium]
MMKTKEDDKCYLLIGEDTWSKNKWFTEIKHKTLTSADEMMNYFEAEDKDITVAKLADIAETLPFFSDKKMIYIKNSGFFKTGKKEETEKFEEFIKNIPEYLVLVIDEQEVDKRSKLYKAIHTKHTVITFDYPGEDKVYGMLEEQVQLNQLKIDAPTLRYFLRNMPENIVYIRAEFDKLIAYTDRKAVTKEDIDKVCVFSLEKRIFELVKRIANRKADEAFQIYHTLIQGKESPIGILVLIARQYRMMLQLKYLLKTRMPSKEIASKMKLPYFALKEMTEQVSLYTFKQLEEILALCLETDKDIKTGKMESVKRVEILIMQCLN